MHTPRRLPAPLAPFAGLLASVLALSFALAFGAAPAAASSPLTVTNAPIEPVEGQQLSGVLATVGDPNGVYAASAYSGSIEWGDGTSTTATITASGGVVSVLGTHTYLQTGPTYLHVSVVNNTAVAGGSDETPIAVADAPLVPIFTAPSVISAAGPSATATSLAVFAAAIGGTNNGTRSGEQPAGFRHVTWDEVKLDGSQPENLPVGPGAVHTVVVPTDTQQELGLQLAAPIAVSNDGFEALNASVAGYFPAVSAANIAAPFNANTLTLDVLAPSPRGSAPTPAATRGLGVAFLNVRLPNTTSIEYRNGDATLAKIFAPATAHGQPSFAGALFAQPIVTSVVITLGSATIFNFDGSFVAPNFSGEEGQRNVVAADDLLLAEPAREGPTLNGTAGTPIGGKLASFGDRDTFATSSAGYTATVDWGDGTQGTGTIAPAAGGAEGWDVSGTHTYAQGGTFKIAVTVHDLLGGAATTLHATALVAAAPPALTSSSSTAAGSATSVPAGGTLGAPRCTLSVPSAVLRAPSRGAKHRAGTHGGSSGQLRVSVRCDQQVSATLTATATLAPAGKGRGPGRGKATALTLGRLATTLHPGPTATLTIPVSPATLAKLRAAVKRHQRISARVALVASNPHGRSLASASAASLRVG